MYVSIELYTRRAIVKWLCRSSLAVGLLFVSVHSTALYSQTMPQSGITLQVVTFGDSLSDVGTYSPFAGKYFNGGKFTTNPGSVWTQLMANDYGGELTPAFVGGFGQPLAAAGGLGYAQGGSRVTQQPGIGHAPVDSPDAAYSAATTVPVSQQIDLYFAKYGSFHPDQLILINAGTNDVLYQLQKLEENSNLLPVVAAANKQAAIDLAELVERIYRAGATHIVVLNVADWTKSPEALVAPSQIPVLASFIQTFNETLLDQLQTTGLLDKVTLIDTFTFLDQILANLQMNGFTTGSTGSACDADAEVAEATRQGLSDPGQYNDSLFCSAATLVSPDADQTFVFADTLHPTTHYSALFASYVEQQIANTGVGR